LIEVKQANISLVVLFLIDFAISNKSPSLISSGKPLDNLSLYNQALPLQVGQFNLG
jgi:hypothetical protein